MDDRSCFVKGIVEFVELKVVELKIIKLEFVEIGICENAKIKIQKAEYDLLLNIIFQNDLQHDLLFIVTFLIFGLEREVCFHILPS